MNGYRHDASPHHDAGNGSSRLRYLILISIAIITITLAVYWQVGGHQFIDFDDGEYVTANPHVATGISIPNIVWAFTAFHSSNWHPVTWLSLMTDAQLLGLAPGGFHLSNVIIHALSAVLLFLLLFRVTRCIWQSSFVAALFALHPLHVESVAWVAERKDVLSAFFWFLTLLLYAAYVAERKKTLYLLTLFSFVLGLMSKPMLVTFPLVLLLFDFWPLKRYRLKGQEADQVHLPGTAAPLWPLLKEKIPFFACSLVSAVITLFAQHAGKAMNRVPLQLGLENAAVTYVGYLAKALWPHNLAIFYPLPPAIPLWQTAGSLAALFLVSAAVILARRSAPFLAAGWFWYLVTLVPVIGLVPVGEQAMADRYTYIPLVGIFLMVAWGVPGLVKNLRYRQELLALLAGALVLVSAALTWQQLRYWQDSISLFRHTLQVTPNNHTAHNMMGNALANKGDLDAATREYQAALAINPTYEKARRNLAVMHINRGNSLANQGDSNQAIKEYQESLLIDPSYQEAHNNLVTLHNTLGNALATKGDLDSAIRQYREALSLAPEYVDGHNNLGIALAKKGDLNAAVKEFRAALAIDPNSTDAHNNLDFALAQGGNAAKPGAPNH